MAITAEILKRPAIEVEIHGHEKVEVTLRNMAIVSSDGKVVEIGDGLKLENNTLSVDTADVVEEDNTKPITAGAVYTEIGNIETLLSIL